MPIPRVSAKLKRSSTPYTCNGETVYINLDRQDGTVSVSREYNSYDVFDVLKEDIQPFKKSGSSIKSAPKKLSSEEIADKDDLNAFYDAMALVMPFNCEECSKPLYAHNKYARRSVTCHILPKGLFPSLATNVHNILFMGWGVLGVCDCHTFYDASVENRVKMKVYPSAIDSFATYLRHELNDTELISACEYLGLDWRYYQ